MNDKERLKQLIYLAIKNKEVDVEATCRFKEKSTYVYPKDVDYVVRSIYMYDDYNHMFEFRISKEDTTEPMSPTMTNKYSVIHDKHLKFSNFKATIKGTDLVFTLDELKDFMVEGTEKIEELSLLYQLIKNTKSF